MDFMQIIGGVILLLIVASLCFMLIWNTIKGGYLKNKDQKIKQKDDKNNKENK